MHTTPRSFAEVPGARLAFTETGEGIPLLCVHGSPFREGTRARVATRMQGTYRLLMPDLVGAGATVGLADARYDMASQIETLLAFAEPAVQVGITAPTLFLRGREDRIFPLSEGRKLPASFGGTVEFEEIPFSRFLPHEEQPGPFASRALAFLARHVSRDGRET